MFRALCLLFGLLLTIGCGSSSPPTAPLASATPSAAPEPGPSAPAGPLLFPVPERNTIFLPAPAPPPSSSDPLAGRYTVDIAVTADAGVRCESVPEHAKRRTYTADIASRGDHYSVALYDARFLRDSTSLGFGCSDRRLDMRGVCHQFVIYRDGPSGVAASIVPEDEWRGSEIWEVLPEGRLLAFTGTAHGSIENGQIRAAGNGNAWYGNGLPGSEYGACQGNMSVTLTRR